MSQTMKYKEDIKEFFKFSSKEITCNADIWVWFLGQEDPLEQELASHSSILAWEIPWTEQPGRLQSMGLQYDLATKLPPQNLGKVY